MELGCFSISLTVRELHRQLKAAGLEIARESIAGDSGPASFCVIDPDGNPVLIDQHR